MLINMLPRDMHGYAKNTLMCRHDEHQHGGDLNHWAVYFVTALLTLFLIIKYYTT